MIEKTELPASIFHISQKEVLIWSRTQTKNFDVFLDYLEEAISQYCDAHWREQHVNMGLGMVKYDKFYKTENLEEELIEVFETIGETHFIHEIKTAERKNISVHFSCKHHQ